jgi:hypothetical protein
MSVSAFDLTSAPQCFLGGLEGLLEQVRPNTGQEQVLFPAE